MAVYRIGEGNRIQFQTIESLEKPDVAWRSQKAKIDDKNVGF
jgi:hypothetical protein